MSSVLDCGTGECSTGAPFEDLNSTVLETYPCPLEFKKFYCLNNSNCFVIKIENSLIYNCECTDGYVGQRCEFKNLEQSYLRSRYNAMLQQASLTSAFIVMMVLIILFILYLYVRKTKKRPYAPKRSSLIMEYEIATQSDAMSSLPFAKPV